MILDFNLSSICNYDIFCIHELIKAFVIFLFSFSWKVVFGDINQLSTGDQKSPKERKITRVTKHPKFHDGIAYYDIALLNIEEVQYSATLRPICLPDSNDFDPDKYAQVN
jgi:hypothetical protein